MSLAHRLITQSTVCLTPNHSLPIRMRGNHTSHLLYSNNRMGGYKYSKREERKGKKCSACLCMCSYLYSTMCPYAHTNRKNTCHMCQHVSLDCLNQCWVSADPGYNLLQSVEDAGLQATIWEAIHLGPQTESPLLLTMTHCLDSLLTHS